MSEHAVLTDESIFGYIQSQSRHHQSELMLGARQMVQQCTPSFRAQIDAPLAITLSVAAEDETAHIEHTLLQYTNQVDPPPYRLLTYLNFDEEAAGSPDRMTAVNGTISIIKQFMHTHPEVPIGVVMRKLQDPSIGAIRKFIADLALMFSASSPYDDTLMVVHDADLIKLHPSYLRRMGDAFDKGMPAGHILSSAVRHAYGHELPQAPQLPNMDIVNAWHDLGVKLTKSHYELGVGIRGSDYAALGGYEPTMIGGSTLQLIRRLREAHGIDDMNWQEVTGATLLTSPRRLYHKLLLQKTAREFWEAGDMQTHDYRTFDPTKIEDISDVDRDMHVELIINSNVDALYDLLRQRDRGQTAEDICHKINTIVRIGHTIIGSKDRPIGHHLTN